MVTKDTLCIIIAIFSATAILYFLIQESRKKEMFEMAHLIQVLGNGDIMWYPTEQQLNSRFGQYLAPYRNYQQSEPAIGNVQPYYIKCNDDKNQQLCTYLKSHQAPSPQFQDSRAYSDWAQQRATAGIPTRPFNSTW